MTARSASERWLEMQPRNGLYAAVVGLAVAGGAALFFVSDWSPYPANHTGGAGLGFALFLIFAAIFGVIVMVAGLVMAGVLALIRQRDTPSSDITGGHHSASDDPARAPKSKED